MPDALSELDEFSAALNVIRRDAVRLRNRVRAGVDLEPLRAELDGHLDTVKRILPMLDSHIRRQMATLQLVADSIED